MVTGMPGVAAVLPRAGASKSPAVHDLNGVPVTMTPVRHRLFAIASVLSLLFCVGLVVLWVRGYYSDDSFSVVRNVFDGQFVWVRAFEVGSCNGGIGAAYRIAAIPPLERTTLAHPKVDWFTRSEHSDPPDEMFPPNWARSTMNAKSVTWRYWQGFVYRHDWATNRDQSWAVGVPVWFAVLVTLVLPLMGAFPALRRRRQARSQSCTTCGYNLTGNTSGVCPECGKTIRAKPAAKT